jgi:hypothetical protein
MERKKIYIFVLQSFYHCHNETYLPAFGSATTSTRSAPAPPLPPSLPSRTTSTTTTRTRQQQPQPWRIRIPGIRCSDRPMSIRGKTIWQRQQGPPIPLLTTEQVI